MEVSWVREVMLVMQVKLGKVGNGGNLGKGGNGGNLGKGGNAGNVGKAG